MPDQFRADRTVSARAKTGRDYSVMQTVWWLRVLADAVREAEAGRTVYITEWIDLAHRNERDAHALIRALLLIVSSERVSDTALDSIATALKSVTEQRRRPERPAREPGERISPRLW